MVFIEENVNDYPINRAFLSHIHKIIVAGLLPPPHGEGDTTPGEYRKFNLKINKSLHLPPDWLKIEDYMNELICFINKEDKPKYDLLKAAIAHHRFFFFFWGDTSFWQWEGTRCNPEGANKWRI
jgi:Fic family protein